MLFVRISEPEHLSMLETAASLGCRDGSVAVEPVTGRLRLTERPEHHDSILNVMRAGMQTFVIAIDFPSDQALTMFRVAHGDIIEEVSEDYWRAINGWCDE